VFWPGRFRLRPLKPCAVYAALLEPASGTVASELRVHGARAPGVTTLW